MSALGPRASWPRTTHDWSRDVDHAHLEQIRRDPDGYAPGGALHLVLEVMAYAADEARGRAPGRGPGQCLVTLHVDGSISVSDDGRGTDTRLDAEGRPVRKPVLATPDLRFFAGEPAERLPDGQPRRGLSVVAALSEWLEHTNRRTDGSWRQRYERGVPITDLLPVAGDGTTGTTVRFQPDPTLVPTALRSAVALGRVLADHPLTADLSVSILVEPSTIAPSHRRGRVAETGAGQDE